jgi:hypothetical protein
MTSKSKQRYILHKPDESSGPKVCAFFKTDKGCKSGASCKFSHGDVATLATAPPKVIVPTPVVTPAPPPPPPPQPKPIAVSTPVTTTTTPKTSDKKKRKSTEDPENEQQKKIKSKHEEQQQQQQPQPQPQQQKKVVVPSTPKQKEKPATPSSQSAFPVTPFHPPGYRPSDDDEDESSFLNFAVNSALSQSPEALKSKPVFPTFANGFQPSATFANFFLPPATATATATTGTAQAKSAEKAPKVAKKSPGKALVVQQPQAPVVSFVLPQSQTQAIVPKQQTSHVPHAFPFQLTTAALPPSISPPPEQAQVAATLHVPVDPRVSDWSDLVQQCANHSRYAKDYTFASDSEWIQAKPYGEWLVSSRRSFPPSLTPFLPHSC